jgi:ABC-type nitrate/sulfonate/bicarbonate transport system ATPase subunit
VLLLDDPLSALDVHTAAFIVDNCLSGDLVAGRTVLLVTHNVPVASRVARFMVVIGSDGSIQQGEVEQLLVSTDMPGEQAAESFPPAVPLSATAKIAITEEVTEGRVEWPACAIQHPFGPVIAC